MIDVYQYILIAKGYRSKPDIIPLSEEEEYFGFKEGEYEYEEKSEHQINERRIQRDSGMRFVIRIS